MPTDYSHKRHKRNCHQCDRCYEKGNCPANKQKCHKCRGNNHFKEFCHSRTPSAKTEEFLQEGKATSVQAAMTISQSRRGGKKKGTTHFKKKPKQKMYSVTMKQNAVIKGGEIESGNVPKMVLSEPPPETGMSTTNRFACFAVHSKLVQSTNNGSNASKVRDHN